MTIDVYTSTGTKKGTLRLPASLFEAPIKEGLIHQAVVRQQNNRRTPVAHTLSRGDIHGSTRKLFVQKGTGRARRGSKKSPLLRGGNKAFGPSRNATFRKEMPKKMRRAALRSTLSMQAKAGKIIGLESYPDTIKTKDLMKLLEKLPVNVGRKILLVTPKHHQALYLSAKNIPKVKVLQAGFINPEDVLGAWHIVFVEDSVKVVEELFGESTKKQAYLPAECKEKPADENKKEKKEPKPQRPKETKEEPKEKIVKKKVTKSSASPKKK